VSSVQRPSVPTWSSAQVARALVVAVVVLDLFALSVVGFALHRSWSQYRERAVVATQNLAAALEQYLSGVFDRIDVTLLAVVDEHERELRAGGVDDAVLEPFLKRQRERVPLVAAVRIFDARGELRLGAGRSPARRISIADRPHFTALRDDPARGLIISEPIVSRLTGAREIVFIRPLRDRDGAFAGAVTAVVPLQEIMGAFAGINVGPRGVIVLRDEALGLVLRHQAEGATVAVGSRTVSPELQALVAEGRTSGTYAGVAVDGVERTFTFRKVSRHPLHVIVGVAFADYLGDWVREALVASGIVLAFAVLVAVAAAFGFRSWRRRETAVEALAEQETRFRLVAESASDLIWMVDRARRLTYVSPAVQRLLGYTPAEALVLPEERLVPAASRERTARVLADAGPPAPFSQPFADVLLEHDLVASDGRHVQVETHFNLRWAADGRLLGAIGISRDVTERRQMQARVQLAERMAAVGTLAAGVAHEVNNPLTYVLSNVSFAVEQLRATEPEWGTRGGCAPLRDAGDALREALTGAERVRHIVRDLRTFSRPESDRPRPVDVNAVVDGCLKMATALISARAQIVRELGEVPPVLASEPRIAQVILNLLVNAAHAIPEGRPADHRITVSTALDVDGRVAIAVADTGSGIAAEALPRIFDPFFTTKAVGEGTGLGLSICHGIVKGLGGEIRVETAPGRGSRFLVLLPREAPEVARGEPAGGRTDVLV
jgi:PAS domain S-box-containing protein